MTVRGRQGAIPTPDTRAALADARLRVRIARDDHERRDLARAVLRDRLRALPDGFSGRYDTIALQRYLDLICARLRTAGPVPRATIAPRGLVALDLLAGLDGIARAVAAGQGGGR